MRVNTDGFSCVSDAHVYGFDEAVKGSKYPMSVSTDSVSSELTKTVTKLATADIGSGHDNFLNGIVVQFDLTFTNKAWVEAERYHFLDFVSSQSTMHRITKFNLDDAYIEYTDKAIIERMKELVNMYNTLEKHYREAEPKDKEFFKEASALQYLRVLYSNPAGMRLTARMVTNYRQLKTIYHQRKNHRLPEWREFCAWIEELPHSEFITGKTE